MRIVNADTRKISSSGIHSNSGRTSAMLRAKKVSTQKNTKRQTARKTPMKMSAASDAKNAAISLRAPCQMLRMGRPLPIAAGGDLRKDRLDVALLRAQPEQGIAILLNGARDPHDHPPGTVA